LFERPGGPELVGPAGLPPGKGVCALHPGNVAIGACKRCGNLLCPVCRTRWHDKVVCLTCVERLLGNVEVSPEERAAHGRQALLGLVLGVSAWVLVALAALPILLGAGRQDRGNSLLLALMLLIGSLIPAILGLGQSAAAIRLRGPRLTLATSGLVVSGCHLGIFLGLILLQIGRP
jgi:hypothetical protein